jgi:hypothetical protein
MSTLLIIAASILGGIFLAWLGMFIFISFALAEDFNDD